MKLFNISYCQEKDIRYSRFHAVDENAALTTAKKNMAKKKCRVIDAREMGSLPENIMFSFYPETNALEYIPVGTPYTELAVYPVVLILETTTNTVKISKNRYAVETGGRFSSIGVACNTIMEDYLAAMEKIDG